MKPQLLIIFALLGVTAIASSDQVPVDWVKRYRYEDKVITTRNFTAYKALLADGYKWIQPDGTVKSRKETLAELGEMFKAKKITVREKVKRVAQKEETVDVSFDAKVYLFFPGKGTVLFHEVGIDSWQKIGGKWKIVRTADTLATQKEL